MLAPPPPPMRGRHLVMWSEDQWEVSKKTACDGADKHTYGHGRVGEKFTFRGGSGAWGEGQLGKVNILIFFWGGTLPITIILNTRVRSWLKWLLQENKLLMKSALLKELYAWSTTKSQCKGPWVVSSNLKWYLFVRVCQNDKIFNKSDSYFLVKFKWNKVC